MTITQRTIKIETPSGAGLPCYFALPESGQGPGLLLLHDMHGLNDHTKHLANRYAEEGWVVATPDLYWRRGEHLAFGHDSADTLRATECAESFDSDLGVRDAATVLAALNALAESTGQAGVLGHGLGGRLAYLLAARDKSIACAVGYYPAEIEQYIGIAPQIACPTLIHLGVGADAAANASLANLRAQLGANECIEVQQYAVPAGFDNPNLPDFDRSAHWFAKSRTLGVLRKSLGPVYDLAKLWEEHLYSEFADRDVDVSMATMVDEPYVFVVPTVTGGTGKRDLHRWYSNHFHFQNPPDTTIIPISRTIGADRVVDEFIFCFTHDRVMDWILPAIAPTGKYVEVPMMAVVNFRGPKLYHEHISWDQATVLVQAGLLDPTGLPVTGIEQSKAMQDESLPRNRLIPGWG